MEVVQDSNIYQSIISKTWSHFLSTESIDWLPGQEWPRTTTASENFFLSLSALRNHKATTSDLVSDLQAAMELKLNVLLLHKNFKSMDYMQENW